MNNLLGIIGVTRIVIWGITRPNHSHFFIHNGFYLTLKKKNISVVWLEDLKANNEKLLKNDLIFTVNVSMSNLKISNDYYYCFHNVSNQITDEIEIGKFINLQVLTNDSYLKISNNSSINIDLKGLSFFSENDKTIYQSWGVPYLQSEFCKPKYIAYKNYDFFVGSIWNNEFNQGNFKVVENYKNQLSTFGIKFVHVQGCSETFNRIYVRNSAVAASVVGDWQRENGYTPCRVFKSVAYGRLGLINSDSSINQYPWLQGNESIPELLDYSLSITQSRYVELVNYQQEFLKFETYESKIFNILTALAFLKENN